MITSYVPLIALGSIVVVAFLDTLIGHWWILAKLKFQSRAEKSWTGIHTLLSGEGGLN